MYRPTFIKNIIPVCINRGTKSPIQDIIIYQIIVINPKAGTYEEIVKAAEKCTAGAIHPGTPFNPREANLEKLIKRAEKYQ